MRRPSEPGAGDEVSALLSHWREPAARERLFAIMYPELRHVAQLRMGRERPDHTLQPTALVNEVFLRLIRQQSINWQNRAHFLAIASQMMRRILIDHARSRPAAARAAVQVDPEHFSIGEDFSQLLELDDLLNRLAERDARAAQVVELRYFGGLTFEEVAHVLEITDRTAKRDWQLARAWLFTAMHPEDPDDGGSKTKGASAP